MSRLSDDERARLVPHVLRDAFHAQRILPRQLVQWVRDGRQHAELLLRDQADPPAAAISVFWIRLQGIFLDIEPRIRAIQESLTPEPCGYDPIHSLISEAVVRVDVLRHTFTDDELMWIDYQRHSHAHPAPSAFGHELLNGDDIRREYPVKALGRRVALVELDEALTRVFEGYGKNERRAAIAIAAKAILPLSNVEFALDAWRHAQTGVV